MAQLATLTRAQKAAAILVAMGKPSASRLLKFFKQEELKALVEGAREMRTVPQSELEKIVAEFESEFAEGAGLLDSGDQMDTLLSESLSPEEVTALMANKEAVVTQDTAPPIWPELEKLEPARLGAFLAEEHPQTVAMILSNLAPGAAAKVVVTLEKSVRGEVVKRMLTMAPVPAAAQSIVESRLRNRLTAESATKDVSAGKARVASLLNELDRSDLDEVLGELEAAGSTEIEALRSQLFSFEDIGLLTQKARVSLFDGLPTDLVTAALRGAPADLTEAVLSALGARSRRMIESELGAGDEGVAAEEITRARKSIAASAIRLSQEGAFELPQRQQAA